MIVNTNEYQTPVTEEWLHMFPEEVQEQFMDCINNIPFIKWLIDPKRPHAKDCPHDVDGKVIVDIIHPHIIEDMDYFRQPALHFEKHHCYTFLRPSSNPQSEYYRYWQEEIRRCREGYVRESDGEWVTGRCYWFMNYNPMMINRIIKGTHRAERVESFPYMWEGIYLRFHYIQQARTAGRNWIELAKRGVAKAHPYDAIVYTPDGPKMWGDIQIGDKLFGDNGDITTVVDIPFNDICDIYELTLKDGRKVQASGEHLWNVSMHGRKDMQRFTTKELMEVYKRVRKKTPRNPSGVEYVCSINANRGVDFKKQPTMVDPYTFGLLLGDGCFRRSTCYITQDFEDMEAIKQYIPYEVSKMKRDIEWKIDIPDWTNTLKSYGLYFTKSEDKFIPDEYKYNTREVRKEIIAGLIDSDGYVLHSLKRPYTYITISSPRLRDDIIWIARSLGYNAWYTTKKAGYKVNGVYKQCLDCYCVCIATPDMLAKLPRKRSDVIIKSDYTLNRPQRTRIVNIEYVGIKPAKCVTVDNDTHRYLIEDFITTHNSYALSSMMTHGMFLGETKDSKRVINVLAAAHKDFLSDSKDGTLSKFRPAINFIKQNTPLPRLFLKESPNEMTWQMGYKRPDGSEGGSLNTAMAISLKDDAEKLRGKRGFIYFEEMGSMPNLLTAYDTSMRSVFEGDYAFGQIGLVGTAAEDEADFSSAKTLLYAPDAYKILSVENVYDHVGQGKARFGYFFPAYINRAGCYNEDGVSDVTKALMEVLMNRYSAKYGANTKSVLRVIAEDPITPAEAIIKVKAAYFPVQDLNDRLSQLEDDHEFDDVAIGVLDIKNDGSVQFRPTNDIPIRQFPVSNDTPGAIEFFAMPEEDSTHKVMYGRYIIGVDPVDNDAAESSSLFSVFVFDLFTDRIVAEFTGRKAFADDNYEIVRRLAMFYNAKVMYEAHAYSEKVPTPDGFKLWADIKVGDTLFSPTQGTTKVVNIPVDMKMPIYKVTLADGRVITASDRHIWNVYHKTETTPINITTEEMMRAGLVNKHKQHQWFIPEANGVDYPIKQLPIDPYTMGLILSEGSIRGSHCKTNYVQISSSFEDMKYYDYNIPYNVKYIGKSGYSWHVYIDGVGDIMNAYGLYGTDSYTKFIPDDYMYSHYTQRMNLLKGLMDGDGCAATSGAPVYVTMSERLKDNIMTLARSLGMKTWCKRQKNGSYRISIATVHKIFGLPRKVVEQHIYQPYAKGSKASAILYKTAIVDIQFSHYGMGKCVTVDAPDGLYYINDYVITHNSNKKGLFPYFQKTSSTHLLAETPQYLRDRGMVKYSAFGSNAYGINASSIINNYANSLIRDWLNKPMMVQSINEEGAQTITPMPTLYSIKSKALLEELVAFQPEINVDRIRALGMVMMYREEKLILCQGDMQSMMRSKRHANYLGDDKFFNSYKPDNTNPW